MTRGKFIVFEGLDRSGKSTQAKLVYESGVLGETVAMRFPNRETPIGRIINSYLEGGQLLKDEVIHLLFSANRWECADEIEETLNRGVSIVCDRYWYSGVAYSSAKGLDIDWCRAPDLGLPQPDAVFFIDISSEEQASRGDFGRERYERLEFQAKVREAFMKLKSSNWVVIDGNQPAEAVQSEIQRALNLMIK